MNKSLCFVFCTLLSAPLAAEVYKWVDENGDTHYGEHPPANASAIYVDVRPNLMEGLKKQDCPDCQAGKPDQPVPAQPPAAQPVAVAPAPIHGLPFEIFIYIQRGMSEAEVLLRAGTPDQEVIEGTQENSVAIASTTKNTSPQTGQAVRNTIVKSNTSNLVIKTYYYLPTIADPFTTIITFRGGWVNDIQRIRKL